MHTSLSPRSSSSRCTPSIKERILNILTVAITCSACAGVAVGCGGIGGGGGGGGSDQPNDPGRIVMRLERDVIDVGNLSQVYIEANDINENGVLLKLHYPTSLTYSKRSAVLFPGEDKEEYIFPYTEATSGNDRYLVFFFNPSRRIGDDIRLALNLKAVEKDESAYIEVGLSNNDPNVHDSEEFSVNKPFFAPLESEDIFIRGSSASETPTPSASGTKTPAAGGPTPAATATASSTTTPES